MGGGKWAYPYNTAGIGVGEMICLLFLVIGFFVGYQYAHFYIANECEKLGGFFVGNKIYECKRVIKK